MAVARFALWLELGGSERAWSALDEVDRAWILRRAIDAVLSDME